MAAIDFVSVRKRFGTFAALDGVDLSVADGQFIALLGPSGSGKTTLLRLLAGLDFPDEGDVRIAGQSVLAVPARERGIGLVFQHYALFRHLTVADNVAFGLSVRRRAKREIAATVDRLLTRLGIADLAGRYPAQLSGGQRQRVALARALAIEPKVLLLDEPFGALDAAVRKDLRRWLRDLQRDLGVTTVMVTHDQDEALELADQVVVLNRGRIEQSGTPAEIVDHPANDFVFRFVGDATALPGPDGRPLLARPHEITLRPDRAGRGVVRHVTFGGAIARLDVDWPGSDTPVEIAMPRTALNVVAGDRVELAAPNGRHAA